jgi:hypothetical protein
MGDLGVQEAEYITIPQEVHYGWGFGPAAAKNWGKEGKGRVLGGGEITNFF